MKTIGKKLKAIYLMAVIALVSICMSFIPLMTNTVKADVEPSPTTGLRITGAQVKVIDGATQEDGNSQFAVYFHTEITEDFYNALSGDKIQFGMIVGPEAMIEGFSSLPATAPVADFDEAVGTVVTEGNLVDVNKSANFRFVGTDLQEAVEFTNGIYTFEAGVVFDEAYLLESGIDDVLKLAAATRLTAVPYYVVGDNATINSLDAVTRTAKDILIETAVRVMYGSSDSDFDQATIGYFGQKYVGNIEEEEREYYMEASTGKVYATNANNELVEYRGEDLDQANIASGAFAGVPMDQIDANPSNIAVGDIFSMAYTYNDGTIRVLPIKMVTKVLSTVKDFFNDADGSGVVEPEEMIQANYIFDLKVVAASGARNPQIAIKGYYVLANNIDLQGKTALTASGLGDQTVQIFDGSQDVGFRATLDGRGFALTNGNPGNSSGGMFGAFYGATIKNIAFDGFTSTRNDGSELILGYVYKSTFENVYIRVVGNEYGDTWLSSNAGLSTFGISDTHGGSTFTNVVFENTVGLEANKTNDHYRGIFTGSTEGKFENTTIIGMPVKFRFDKHATDTEKYVLSLSFPQDVLASFGVEAGQVALEEVPEAVTNAYGNLIANLESKAEIDIAYINFVADIEGRAYYVDKASFNANTDLVATYEATNCWKVVDGALVWSSLTAKAHTYNEVVTAPTCESQGYTTYTCTCACGDTYVGNYVPQLDHEYEEVVTAPTCTEQGYTTYTCVNGCNQSYKASYVDPQHNLDAAGEFCTLCGEVAREGQVYEQGEFIIEKSTGKVYRPDANNELKTFDASSYIGEATTITVAGIEQTVASATAFAFDKASLESIADGQKCLIVAGENLLVAKVVTKVLATLEDFFNDANGDGTVASDEMTRANYIFNLMPLSGSGAANPRIAIKGYYVLANNIDLKSNGNLCNRSMNADGTNGSGDHTVQIFDGSQDVGFRGTLDGRGFALKNINAYGSSAGMFGAFYGATVKNIAFDGATNSASNGSGLVIGYVYRSTFENVYIRLIGNNGGDTYTGEGAWNALYVQDAHGGSNFNNLVVENYDGLASGKTNIHQRFGFTGSAGGTFTNTAIVGMPVAYKCAASTTDASKMAVQLTMSQEAMTALGVTAGEIKLSDLPEAVSNAYANLIANIEARAKVTGIGYINFIEDAKDRDYYLDNASLVADTTAAETYTGTGFWKVVDGKLVWASLQANAHTYVETVTAPTCTEVGYTTYACTCVCGDTYVANVVDALGHTISGGLCIVCGEYAGEGTIYEEGEFIVDKFTGKVLKANANNELVAYDATSYLGEETVLTIGDAEQTIASTTEFAVETAGLADLTDGAMVVISAGQNVLVAQVVTKVFFNVNDFFTDLNSDGAITDDEKVQTNNFFNVATAGTADKKVTGYYVLANNIDATGAPLKANNASAVVGNTSADFGFQATLDGRGFALSNLNVFNGAGLFGLIKNATIKDIAIRNLSNTRDDSNRPLIANAIINSTLENVYITVAEYSQGWNQKYRTTSNAIGSITNSTLTNVIFENNAWKSNNAAIQKSENSWYGFGPASATATYANVNVIGAPITVGYKVQVAAEGENPAQYKVIFTMPLATIQQYVAGAGVYALADCGGAEADFAKLIAGIKAGETSGTASLANMDIQYIEFVAETSTRGYFYDNLAIASNETVANAYVATGFWKVVDGALVWASL